MSIVRTDYAYEIIASDNTFITETLLIAINILSIQYKKFECTALGFFSYNKC